MKCFILWHGGNSYGVGDLSDVEAFDSIKEGQAEFLRRENGFDSYYPCVEGSSAYVWFKVKPEGPDPYPQELWEVGPQGGLKVTPC